MVEEIKTLCEEFIIDARKAETGNKAAGTRARKTSLELSKKLLAFRKESVAWGK